MKEKKKYVTNAIIYRRRWGHNDYYHVIEVQVDNYLEGFREGDVVKVTIERKTRT